MDILKWTNQFKKDMQVSGYDADDTIPNYGGQISSFLKYFEDKYNHPKHISAESVKDYLLSKERVNTQRHAHSAIKLFYKLTAHQPLKLRYVKYAKKEKKLPSIIEENEIQAILDVCKNTKHKAILSLAYGCGLRVSEIINLKISDIDSNAMVIAIICAKGKKDRIVPLPQDLLDILRKYFREYRPKEYLFNGQNAPQYSERSINQFLKDLAKKAGVKRNVHIHLVRHSYATHSLEQGVDIRYIQEILGHSSPKTTNIYTHVSKKAISRIQSPLSKMNL